MIADDVEKSPAHIARCKYTYVFITSFQIPTDGNLDFITNAFSLRNKSYETFLAKLLVSYYVTKICTNKFHVGEKVSYRTRK